MSQPLSQSIYAAQEALSTTAEEAIPFRSGRQRVTIQNLDNSISVAIGFDNTVSTSTGIVLRAGESIRLETAASIWAEAASGTPTIAYVEEYE